MGVKMEARSFPGFLTSLTHGPSGSVLDTEAPVDNGGKGTSFSPTDLIGAGLLSCEITTMALVAQREGIRFGECQGSVEKIMSPPPRRIAELILEIRMPGGLSDKDRVRMEETARKCPVKLTLNPEVVVTERFVYPD
jgi:putative redox protein